MEQEKARLEEHRTWQPRETKGSKGQAGKRSRGRPFHELYAPCLLLTASLLVMWHSWDIYSSRQSDYGSYNAPALKGVSRPILLADMQQQQTLEQFPSQEGQEERKSLGASLGAASMQQVTTITAGTQQLQAAPGDVALVAKEEEVPVGDGEPPEEKKVYKPVSLAEAVRNAGGEERRVILATATSNYLDQLNDWLESVEDTGASQHVLLIAEDQEAYDAMVPKMPNSTVKGWEVYEMPAVGAPRKGAGLDHGPFFNSIVMRRPHYIGKLLDLNVSVLYSDVDVIFNDNPFKALQGDFDMLVQDDAMGSKEGVALSRGPALPSRAEDMNLCPCFMYLHPNLKTKWLVLRWIWENEKEGVDRTTLEGMADQIAFNSVVKAATDENCKIGVLSQLVFPSGCIFFGCKPGIRDPYLEHLNGTRWEAVAKIIHNRPTAQTAGAGQLDVDVNTASMAGPPVDEVVKRVAGAERMVIIATATANYMDFVMNWLISVEVSGYKDHVLLIAEDELAFYSLNQRLPNQTVKGWEIVAYEAAAGSVSGGGFFYSSFFNQVVMRRPNYILSLLKMGVDVLYSDVDIVFVKDPFPHFKGDFDIWVQDDSNWVPEDFQGMWNSVPPVSVEDKNAPRFVSYCTCFMFVKSNARSMATVERWRKQIKAQSAESKTKSVKNQGAWNRVITNRTEADARIAILPRMLFPSGCVFFTCKPGISDKYLAELNGTAWGSVVTVVHNNGVKFHQTKKERFQKNGIWYVNKRR